MDLESESSALESMGDNALIQQTSFNTDDDDDDVDDDVDDGKALSEFQAMWSIKQKDLAWKERLSKMSLLTTLIAKPGPLSEQEEALKKKLITEMLAN